ncbi:MAG: PaaI family thioesterase [Marinifilaceae bacterium]
MNNVLEQLNKLCSNTLVSHLGIQFTACGSDFLIATMPIDHRTCRPDGCLHGGANLALAETMGGALGAITLPDEKRWKLFGIEVNGNHIKQARGSYVTAKATFLHNGKRSQVVDVRIEDEFGTLVTSSRVTNMLAE